MQNLHFWPFDQHRGNFALLLKSVRYKPSIHRRLLSCHSRHVLVQDIASSQCIPCRCRLNDGRSLWPLDSCVVYLHLLQMFYRVVSKFMLLSNTNTCNFVTYYQNFCTAGKHIKFAIKSIQQYPPHLRHVARIPWEIKNSNFLQIFSRYGSCLLYTSDAADE